MADCRNPGGRLDAAERRRIGARQPAAGPDWQGVRAVIFSRTGLGILITYLTSGYVLFTFKNWLPTFMHAEFNSNLMGGAAWTSLSSGLGFVGFLLAGPVNDALVRRMDRLRARRLGTAVPGAAAVGCLLLSLWAAEAGIAWATATLIGIAQLLSTITAGAWAVSVIDLSPGRASTGILYGIFNGALNLMGAVNALAITFIASHLGFAAAFGSAVGFMLLFIAGMVLVVDRPGYQRLLRHAEDARQAERAPGASA